MAVRYSAWLRLLVGLLSVQFLLGVWVSLYGTFPATSNVVRAALYRGDPVLSVHFALAILLVVLGFVVTLLSFRADAPAQLRWFTLGGFLATLAAYEAGVELVVSGFSSALEIFVMAAAFLAAMGFYGVAQLLAAGGSLRGDSPSRPT